MRIEFVVVNDEDVKSCSRRLVSPSSVEPCDWKMEKINRMAKITGQMDGG